MSSALQNIKYPLLPFVFSPEMENYIKKVRGYFQNNDEDHKLFWV